MSCPIIFDDRLRKSHINRTTLLFVLLPLGAVDNLMHYYTRPLASCNSALGRPQHLGAIILTILQAGMK